jgi:photosystem II stability/assembly factor-like uncharacterized protein
LLKISVLGILLIATVLATNVRLNAQWHVVKRLPAKPEKSLNVDGPPSIESRPPIIWAMSFVDDLNGWAACDDGTLLQTSDGGNKWAKRKIYPHVNTLPPLFVDSIDVIFKGGRKGWIAAHLKSSAVILASNDGGKSWKVSLRVPYWSSTIHNIWFIDEVRGWAVGEAEGRGIIYGTRDGGKTWVVQYKGVGNESFLHEVKFSGATGWAVGDHTVLKSVDGGQTWNRQAISESENDFLFGLDVLSRNEAWVVGSGGGIFHTVDGGMSWNHSSLPSDHRDHWLNSIQFISPNRGWIVGDDGAIFSTSNAGTTWNLESKNMSSYLRGLAISGRYVYAFGNDGVVLRRSAWN